MRTPAPDTVRGLSCRAVVVALGSGASVEQVIAGLSDTPHLAVLTGDWAGGGAVVAADPVVILEPAADPFEAIAAQPMLGGQIAEGFFGGGWLGWFGYDAPSCLAFYDHVLRHRDGQWWFEALWSEARASVLTDRLDAVRKLVREPARALCSWQVGEFTGASMPTHLDAVERAIEWIRAGEVYQVNVCTRLTADFQGDPAALFARAAQRVQPRYGAYLAGPDRSVACLSPELFLRRRGREVTTSPIKGTAPRSLADGAQVLRGSVKDIAENVMIVDLMRNDLGRVSEIGSVRPAALLDIEPHPGVWHLVSTVTGRLRSGLDDADLLRATFPPGSVTGAPKLRAQQAIAQLERAPRGVYTGAVGYAGPVQGLELAVAIRTFEIDDRCITLGVGGGVTADSVPMREWRECLDKAAPLLAGLAARFHPDVATPVVEPTQAQRAGGLLETVLVVDGSPVRLADHLARLDRSSRELYGRGVPAATATRATAAARTHPDGRAVLRIVAAPTGDIAISCTPAPDQPPARELRVVQGRTGLWRHKWADRSALASAEQAPGAPLFVAEDGTVLETSRGNVFLICPDGSLQTPPLRDDLLPGVTRRAVLDIARDSGRTTRVEGFSLAEMQRHAAFWTSSLSGIVAITAVDGVLLPRLEEELAVLRSALAGGDASVR